LLDEDATKEKELAIQAEVYRILKNYANEGLSLTEQLFSGWAPDDVLIEASISDSSGKHMEADLVLMAKGNEYSRSIRSPILVIETKLRKLSNLTRYYQSALKQSRKYAHSIRCPTYSVYDGHTFILMQIPSPFLIGIWQWAPSQREIANRDFARKLWKVSLNLKVSRSESPVPEFLFHPDIEPWKKSFYYFVRDAFRFMIEVDQGMSTQGFHIEREAKLIADKFVAMFRN